MSWILRSAVAVAAGVISVSPALATESAKWIPHLDVEGKLGTERSLGETDLFAPLAQDADTLLFANVRGRFDDDDGSEGNFGLGIRQMLGDGWNGGAYTYFDRRRSSLGNLFSQVTIGAELLGRDWDLRANGYLPVGADSYQQDGLSTAEISGANVIFRAGEEHALLGFDAEIGWRVPVFDYDSGTNLRVFGGGYSYGSDDINESVTGPRGRVELTFDSVPFLDEGSRFSLGAEIQHDEPRGTQGFLSARLRVPLQTVTGAGAPRLTAQERRMADPVMRDIDVVTVAGAFGALEAATAVNGGALTVLNSATISGANLPGAVAAAGANSTVVMVGTFSTSAVTQLQQGQTMIGAGSIGVRGTSGGLAQLSTPGGRIIGAVSGNNGAVHMGNDSTLAGMIVHNEATGGGVPNPFGVFANGVSNASIVGNTVTARQLGGPGTAQGILITNSSNVLARDNSASAEGDAIAIGINVVFSSATIAGNTLSAVGSSSNNSRAFNLNGATILPGSTGNTKLIGDCVVNSPGPGGVVSFTDGSTCGP